MPSSPKKIVVLAGPNGAGKTTFAREFLPVDAGCPDFVNADLIAAGLSPFRPESAAVRAGRLMLELIQEHTKKERSFAFETTLASPSYARWIPEWQRDGYRVELFFLSLPMPELSLARVGQRALQGGHSIPESVIRRRFAAGRQHFDRLYRSLVDVWGLYDNSAELPKVLEWSDDNAPDLVRSVPALRRARSRAEAAAKVTNTAIAQVVNGEIVLVRAE
jgi:predicted ABC-type ATPase